MEDMAQEQLTRLETATTAAAAYDTRLIDALREKLYKAEDAIIVAQKALYQIGGVR